MGCEAHPHPRPSPALRERGVPQTRDGVRAAQPRACALGYPSADGPLTGLAVQVALANLAKPGHRPPLQMKGFTQTLKPRQPAKSVEMW